MRRALSDDHAIRLSPAISQSLRCPICEGSQGLSPDGPGTLRCPRQHRFPVIDGAPVLINESRSVFTIGDFEGKTRTFFPDEPSWLKKAKQLAPTISLSLGSRQNFEALKQLLLKRDGPKILILGGSIIGNEMQSFLDDRFEIVESDVASGPRTQLICDAHDIPFEDGTFDAVIAQAVLEHVADPYRCVEEIHRVLVPNGYVYAETPFMQQVHGGRFDFTRFTDLGHRRLFRRFTEIDRGVIGGPAMALAWSYRYLLLSFAGRRLRPLVKAITTLSSFFLKYLDPLIARTPAAQDAASGYYFLGQRSESTLTDRALVTLYRGAGA